MSEIDQAVAGSAIEARIDDLLEARTRHNHAFFASQAGRLARLCQSMAERFASGGRLVALAASPSGRSDARHVAVEFVHPVLVGKRALPAIALAPEGGGLALQAGVILEPEDIAITFGEDGAGEVREALAIARDRGSLTIAFTAVGAEWELEVPGDDPFIRQELVETIYHVLWELVHVFLEHRGPLAGREESAGHDAGASSFLYPFLAAAESDLEAVAADVERSILMKADEVGALRRQTLTDNRHVLLRAARELRDRLDAGGKVLAFGNGGSATDAMDLVADLREPPRGDWPSRTAIDLTEDASILTAIANDVGVEKVFQRQVIAYGGSGDAAVALSTSGNSANLIEALEECRRRGLATIALAGYDGGRIAAEELADHLVLTRSQHIPRIQEAQASAYHVLRELIELVGARA